MLLYLADHSGPSLLLQMQLKKPDAIAFSKSNAVHPFEDSSSLAFWSNKNDASLLLVGLHSKKRPNNLIFTRTFDHEVMDMLEVGIEMAKSMSMFKVATSTGLLGGFYPESIHLSYRPQSQQ